MSDAAPSSPRPTRLVVIRHGESNSTVDQIVGGHAGCTGLSERGRRQAEALRDRLVRTGELKDTSVLLTSILPRAIETAAIISPALGGHTAVEHCDYCEIHPGNEGDGLSWDEFRARYAPDGAPWARDPYTPAAPDGESWASFFVRVGDVLGRTVRQHRGETVVIVAHGGFIEGTMTRLANLPMQRDFDLFAENTSLTEWRQIFGPEGQERWRLVRYNDFAHLQLLEV